MKIYGVFDKVLEDYVMVTLAPNDKSIIRGIQCPKDANPSDYEIHCLGKPEVDHNIGLISDFIVNEQGGIEPASMR